MEYIEHITADGDRWDTIAYRYYGDASLISPLAEANDHLQLLPVLPAGLPVRVPLVGETEVMDAQELPPWMR
ncbi:tail protein X [Acidovorax sp. GBBC 3332]|nr:MULTISPECIES: tail protein X [unclassified Acidovorax]MDA8449843.1 tail protein X [Acidovorax sp. GBBC 3297]MDA8459288.1 tail protein X [Acidovorax sp. GBBC 3333]MDA8464325.1 tail protein X [Acidovorax sp. GBBC 3332]MDA8469464.1 tail protein X [Acidovorax sp. GBBC 3299]